VDLAEAPPPRCIASIVAAHAKEERDASLVRAQLPQRIDALLPTQLALQFEQELAHIMGCAAHRAALQEHVQAWSTANAALMQLIRAVVKTVEGLEVRLHARSQVSTSDGVVTMDEEHRARLCRGFCDEIAEVVLEALPEVAKIANPGTAASVKVHARQDLQHLQERFSAVMLCKTQLTDLFCDNTEISHCQQASLLQEAVSLLQNSSGLPVLRFADHPQVARFFHRAISRCEDQLLKEDAIAALSQVLLAQGSTTNLGWVRVASLALTALADEAEETAAAVRVQQHWRKWTAMTKTPSRSKCRLSNVHVLRIQGTQKSNSAPASPICSPRVGPIALVQGLLRQAMLLGRRLAQVSQIAVGLEKLQRACVALAEVDLPSLRCSGDATLAFWLNVHNLGTLLGVLLAATRTTTNMRLPSSKEGWETLIESEQLLIGGLFLSASDIAHVVLQAGAVAPMREPRRKSTVALLQGEEADPLVGAGLWMPVRFGLPPLRLFRPEIVHMQLRLNAEALVSECVEASELFGYGPNSIILPPLLQSLGFSTWLPLLDRRGSEALSTHPRQVDWSFDPRRLASVGADMA